MYKIVVKQVLARWCCLDRQYQTQRFVTKAEADAERRALMLDCVDIDPSTGPYLSEMIQVVKGTPLCP